MFGINLLFRTFFDSVERERVFDRAVVFVINLDFYTVSWENKKMKYYYYLSLMPEALIVSMLPPREFGTYLAVGTTKRARGCAMFFALEDLSNLSFDFSDVEQRCAPHPNGAPKHSVYLAIYRVLERTPLEAMTNLYVVTYDGKVLELGGVQELPSSTGKYHLYQEICPVHPRIVSTLDPPAFAQYITSSQNRIYVPKICFVDLRLGELAENPEQGEVRDLPYATIQHLRDCLAQLKTNPEKHTKTVNRIQPQAFPFRVVEHGFYLGDADKLLYYPFPSKADLNFKYYDWWRSASLVGDK